MDYKASLPHTTSLQVEGAFNFRSVGGYRSTIFPGAVIREGLIYRTGHLGNVTEAGWLTIKRLGVSTIINLTSPGEVEIFTGAADKTARPSGITTLHLPVKQGVFSMANQVSKYQVYRNKGLEVCTVWTLFYYTLLFALRMSPWLECAQLSISCV